MTNSPISYNTGEVERQLWLSISWVRPRSQPIALGEVGSGGHGGVRVGCPLPRPMSDRRKEEGGTGSTLHCLGQPRGRWVELFHHGYYWPENFSWGPE